MLQQCSVAARRERRGCAFRRHGRMHSRLTASEARKPGSGEQTKQVQRAARTHPRDCALQPPCCQYDRAIHQAHGLRDGPHAGRLRGDARDGQQCDASAAQHAQRRGGGIAPPRQRAERHLRAHCGRANAGRVSCCMRACCCGGGTKLNAASPRERAPSRLRIPRPPPRSPSCPLLPAGGCRRGWSSTF